MKTSKQTWIASTSPEIWEFCKIWWFFKSNSNSFISSMLKAIGKWFSDISLSVKCLNSSVQHHFKYCDFSSTVDWNVQKEHENST